MRLFKKKYTLSYKSNCTKRNSDCVITTEINPFSSYQYRKGILTWINDLDIIFFFKSRPFFLHTSCKWCDFNAFLKPQIFHLIWGWGKLNWVTSCLFLMSPQYKDREWHGAQSLNLGVRLAIWTQNLPPISFVIL